MAAAVETMAYAGEVPWHGLGKRVSADLTPQEMLVEAGLDWKVGLHDTFSEIDGEKILMPRKALLRESDNKILDTVGTGWNAVQNDEAADLFEHYVQSGGMKMHTAGSLLDGQIVWFLAKVDESFELFKGDVVDSFLLFSNPHKYGKAIDVAFTPIRVVCNNTLRLSLSMGSKNAVKLSHRKAFDAESVKETLNIASMKLDTYRDFAAFLGSKQYTRDTLIDFFNQTFPVAGSDPKKESSKNAVRALEVVEEQPGTEFAPGSWWQAFNAVTFMADHELGRNVDNRLQSAWFGTGVDMKTNTLKRAVEFAEAA